MKKLLIIILAFVAFSCSNGISEKDLLGKYKVKIIMDVDENDEEAALAMMMMASAEIEYEFVKGGLLKSTVSMGSFGSENDEQQYRLSGDSLFIDIEESPDEYFTISKTDDGFYLEGGEINFELTKLD